MNYQNLLNSKIKEIKPSGIRRFSILWQRWMM